MSNEIFPTLPGLTWDQLKVPVFSTRIQRATSGREYRAPYFNYPLYQYTLTYEMLRDDYAHDELKTLLGFYLARQGAYDTFLYLDPSDNAVAAQPIAYGDGLKQDFQMVRTYGGFTEPVFDVKTGIGVAFHIYLDGALQTGTYDQPVLGTGTVHFHSPVGNGSLITADFSYYQRVRFVEYTEGGSDGFNNFMHLLWELKTLSFITAR